MTGPTPETTPMEAAGTCSGGVDGYVASPMPPAQKRTVHICRSAF